ncbi:2-succinyl-5-enolpyruvyl-6-hydroxy-3-cyclohexene-1-carboxylic-acid synthase [Allokutzneria sp. A3M-2-11 16]|uniref:2-succinyl-5-enolpyruvyl-6-hydroxy-3- cyclohexene-1-carboxylic-acid synthase n=1 Tax=Allokutzneria sp. A3M-2-11 16 TaxID=2962043 RepID=UPI0020B80BEB|nr:2-succinyl-5-enolpyruvyl-6-hydroxy-3-cyclohexene-1-carboxylic-acid synthase [Allokutzneria sp. A3M-2-11 16]MCP3798976.1 2-succinyl-5-enolpyruvyl-6-hydroxy-3-cyclohexene-1-carboxylic-acid synthase [Allokutzneria sp. A3M-2-11 16]
MNPSTAQARVVVDELVRNGVRHFVLCPGSRNAPLSFALHDAAKAGRVTLHVRIDERSAGFLALGLSKGLGLPAHRRGLVALACTSGTAVANLHPAVLEAYHSAEPLVVLTADRPPELMGTGANQTTWQHGVFGPHVSTVDFPVAETRKGQNAVWRSMICRAVAHAKDGGPVHVNIPFREPLVPDTADNSWPESLVGRGEDAPWTARHGGSAPVGVEPIDLPARTLVVVGAASWGQGNAIGEIAAERGWPVLAEPGGAGGVASTKALLLRHGTLLLGMDELHPEALVVVGRPTLTRAVQRLLHTTPQVHVVDDTADWTDPQHQATSVGPLALLDRDAEPEWLAVWQNADAAVANAVEEFLAAEPWPTGLHIARDLVAAMPRDAVLFLGSSNPVRDVDLVAATERTDVLANRGLAGIDGSISTAVGTLLGAHDADGRIGPWGAALLGDLTFLHDANGLLIGPAEQRPDLTIVVLNDDGGGIFSLLEQGSAQHADSFERVFATPHGADLASLCAAYRVPHVRARSREQFLAECRPGSGLRVVEVQTDRSALRDLHERLRAAVRRAH